MTMWMVRAAGRHFPRFVEEGLVAIGWPDVGDLNAYGSREAILESVRRSWPDWKRQAQINSAGMLYRFVRQLEPGHHIVTYDQGRRIYAVGVVDGDYRFDLGFEPEYPNVRSVRWIATDVSRDRLTTATKNTLGSTLTLFLLSQEAEQEVLRVVEGNPPPVQVGEIEEEEEGLLQDIEARSLEFIKDRVVRLDWSEMQQLVAGLLRAIGYKTRISPAGPDRGKDIIASPDGFGFEDPRIFVEVKHRAGSLMGSPEIRSFLGGRQPTDKGLYVSTGGFSREAHYEAERANIPVMLMGLDELVEEIIKYYDKLDIETQRLVPLRRVYWPVG